MSSIEGRQLLARYDGHSNCYIETGFGKGSIIDFNYDTEPLGAMNNAVNIYKNLDPEDIKEYSMWKAFREMRTPEMKRGIGFIMLFLKNLSEKQIKN